MKVIIQSTVELDDNQWGWSDLVDGREITDEVKEEIKQLFLEFWDDIAGRKELEGNSNRLTLDYVNRKYSNDDVYGGGGAPWGYNVLVT